MTTMLAIDQIEYDKKYYPRAGGVPDWFTIMRYTEALSLDERHEFPPIVVVRATGNKVMYFLIDGLHRLRSYLKAGREKIPAVIERIPQSKWLARSVELNVTHGRALDTGDKAWIATRLKEHGWEIDSIAGLLKMKVDSLERIVASRCVKLTAALAKSLPEGRSNRAADQGNYGFLKAPLVRASGSKAIAAALQTQHSVTSHDISAVLDSVIAVLESKVVDLSDEMIALRVERIRTLLSNLEAPAA